MSHAAYPAAPAAGREPPTLTLHRAPGQPGLLGTDERAPAQANQGAPAPPATRGWRLPNGQWVTREERGVYWLPHRRGAYHVAYAVDSSGDSRDYERVVLATAPALEFDRAISDLWTLLDIVDPQSGPELR